MPISATDIFYIASTNNTAYFDHANNNNSIAGPTSLSPNGDYGFSISHIDTNVYALQQTESPADNANLHDYVLTNDMEIVDLLEDVRGLMAYFYEGSKV